MTANLHPKLLLLRRLRQVAQLEGTSLLFLLLVAVPLKHWGHMPLGVTVMGPLHGLVFMTYLWVLMQTAVENRWGVRDVGILIAVSLVPFGSIVGAALVRRKISAHVGLRAKALFCWPR